MDKNFRKIDPYACPEANGHPNYGRKELHVGGREHMVFDPLPNLTYLDGTTLLPHE